MKHLLQIIGENLLLLLGAYVLTEYTTHSVIFGGSAYGIYLIFKHLKKR